MAKGSKSIVRHAATRSVTKEKEWHDALDCDATVTAEENKERDLNVLFAVIDCRIAALSHDLQHAVGREREQIDRALRATIRAREHFARPRWLN